MESSPISQNGKTNGASPTTTLSGRVVKRRKYEDHEEEPSEGDLPKTKGWKATSDPDASSVDMMLRFTPQDDVSLKEQVQNFGTFDKLIRAVKFSQKFTAEDLKQRWAALLYDPVVAEASAKAMSTLPSQTKRVLWSPLEEEILRQEAGNMSFLHILEKFRDKFHSSRTAKSLEAHYYRMKRTGAISKDDLKGTKKDQPTIQLVPGAVSTQDRSIGSFADVDHKTLQMNLKKEEQGLDLNVTPDPTSTIPPQTPHEPFPIPVADAIQEKQKELRQLEQRTIRELERDLTINFDPFTNKPNTLAIIRGTKLRYEMRKRCVMLGRAGKDPMVDVNLTEELLDPRISRKQALIRLKKNCEFYITNLGKSIIYVNGFPLGNGVKRKLGGSTNLIEIEKLRLSFDVNKNLVTQIRGSMETVNK